MGLIGRAADYAYPPEHDAVILRALGLVASGAFLLLYAALRLTPSKKVGA